MKPILTRIEGIGQKYIDEPVFREVSKAKPVSSSLLTGLGARPQEYRFGAAAHAPVTMTAQDMVKRRITPQWVEGSFPAFTPPVAIQPVIEELTHYNHVRLRWMKPDGNGGLVPRNKKG